METTVRVKIGDTLLSSVVFGMKDYKTDQEIRCSIVGNSICLFDSETTERVSIGSVVLL